jgi:hypothetical protein
MICSSTVPPARRVKPWLVMQPHPGSAATARRHGHERAT